MTDTQGAHAQPEALRGAPPSAYSQEDRAFYTFWYGHMLNEWMQPPLAGVSHSTARYIWDAAIAHAAAPAHAADSVLEDAARWQMAALIGNEVMLPPDKRTNPAAVKAYMDAVHSGLDLTGAIDAARTNGDTP